MDILQLLFQQLIRSASTKIQADIVNFFVNGPLGYNGIYWFISGPQYTISPDS